MKKKLLLVGSTPPPYNGMSVVMENLLESSLGQDFQLIIVDTADRRDLSNSGKLDIINAILALKHGINFLIKLMITKPDIIYLPIAQNTYGFIRDSLFLIPAKILRKRVVIHLHGSSFKNFYHHSPLLFQKFIRYCLSDVTCAIVLGECLKKIFEGILNIKTDVKVIPNGIKDIARIKKIKRGAPVILYLGNLIKTKGFIDVIFSAPLVLEKYPSAKFIIAGAVRDKTLLKEVEEFIETKGLQQEIVFVGPVFGDEKNKILNMGDIFVFPPCSYEGQPLVILEAMSVGMPVISTFQGAISETVINEETGFIVPVNSPSAIAEKIILLLEDQELAKRYGEAGRKRFETFYTVDKWVGNLGGVFKDLIQKDAN